MDREIVYRYGVIGLEEVQAKTTQTADVSDQAHARIKKGADESTLGLQALDATVDVAKDHFSEFSGSAGIAGEILEKLGAVGIATAAGIGMVVEGLNEVVKSAADGQLKLAQINAVLGATGDVSGQTADGLTELADKLATTTLASRDQVLQAETQLLTFKSVTGGVFDETIKLAQDLASSGFGSITENAVKLGKALEDPAQGLDALRRVGIIFSEQVKDQITLLESQGEHFEAQQLIIDELTKRVGGAGAAAGDTLTGAWHAFGQEFEIALEAVGERTGLLPVLQHAVEGVIASLKGFTDTDLSRAIAELDHLQNTAGLLTRWDVERIAALKDQIATLQAAQQAEEDKAAAAQQAGEIQAALDKGEAYAKSVTDAGYKLLLDDSEKRVAASQQEWDAFQKVLESETAHNDALQTEVAGTKAWSEEIKILAEGLATTNELTLDQVNDLMQVATARGAIIAVTEANKEVDKEIHEQFQSDMASDLQVLNQVEKNKQDAYEQTGAKLQKQLDSQAKAIQKFAEDGGAHVVDAFISMLDGSKKPFDALAQYAEQTFAKIAAEAILNPIVVPIITQAVGGAASLFGGSAGGVSGVGGLGSGALALNGALGGGLSGVINSAGYNLLGIGGGVTTGADGAIAITPYLSSYLGAGALGALGGGLLNNLWGGNSTYGSIGGGTGAMAGMAIGSIVPGLGTALGAAIGGLVGSLAGLFGPGPSDKLEGDWINFGTGGLTPYGYTGAKYSQDNANAAQALANSLVQFGNVLTTAGLSPNFATNARVEAGSNGSPFRVWYGDLNGDTAAGQFSNPQDAFQAMAQQILKSLGTIPADFQKVIDNVDWSNLQDFANQLNEVASFHATLANVHAQLEQLQNPEQYELDQLNAQFQPILDEANKLGEDTTEIQELWDLKKKQVTDKYAAQITATVQGTTDTVVAAVGDWTSIVGQYYDDQTATIQAQMQSASNLLGAWTNVRDSLAQTQNSLLLDSNLSPLSLEQRAQEAQKQFNDAFAKAMGGDQNAAAQLGQLAQTFLTADNAFEHGSTAYGANFADTMSKLAQAQQFAGQQVTIQQLQLNALNAILQTLQSQKNALSGNQSSNYNAADAKSLTGSYAQALAASGMSESDFLNSPSGAVWIAARNQLVAGTTDPALLNADLAGARSQAQQPGMAAIGNDYESKVIAQMNSLGIPVPQYETGTAYVPRTGLAVLHEGERVLTAGDNSNLAGQMKGLRDEIAALRSLVAAIGTRQLEHNAQIIENTGRAADAPHDAALLTATNARTRVL